MPEARSLTIRMRLDGRDETDEQDVLAGVHRLLGQVKGEPRPILEIARAERQDVAASAPEPPSP